jgi:hypothetical protein
MIDTLVPPPAPVQTSVDLNSLLLAQLAPAAHALPGAAR